MDRRRAGRQEGQRIRREPACRKGRAVWREQADRQAEEDRQTGKDILTGEDGLQENTCSQENKGRERGQTGK